MNTMNANNNNEEQITPDMPVMRSVSLMSSAAPGLVTLAPLSLKSTPSRAKFTSPLSSSSPSTAIEQSSWKIGKLQPLPFMYMLERSHVYINGEPEQIVNRIVDNFRKNSISAEFISGENMAEAVTSDNVRFAVRLWEEEDKVLVEVQRLAGCGFSFHQFARSILLSAKGTSQSPRARPVFKIPACVPKVSIEESKDCLKEDLEIAAEMLKCPKIDSHVLALESLVQLTSSSDCRHEAADFVMCQKFLPTLLKLVESSTEKDVPTDYRSEHTELVHRYSLTVLANCLVTLQETGELSRLMQQQGSLLSKSLLVVLLGDVSNANNRPHAATQAARCLQALVTVHRQIMEEQNAMEVVLEAEQFGKQRHSQLEQECRKLAELCQSNASYIPVHI